MRLYYVRFDRVRARLELFLVVAELVDLVKHLLEVSHLLLLLRLVLPMVLLEHRLVELPVVWLPHRGLRL